MISIDTFLVVRMKNVCSSELVVNAIIGPLALVSCFGSGVREDRIIVSI